MKLRAFCVVAALAAWFAPVSVRAQTENVARLENPCASGEFLACANLAVLYKHGRNVMRDYPKALTLFLRACEGGVNFACGNVGEMTYLGLGVPANDTDGAPILRGACRRGDAWSCETARRLGVKMPKKRPA
ncbi:MAG: tetratricopeptide repeat protein [Parvularculaceae bacterium]